jgi:hypothetical protein
MWPAVATGLLLQDPMGAIGGGIVRAKDVERLAALVETAAGDVV